MKLAQFSSLIFELEKDRTHHSNAPWINLVRWAFGVSLERTAINAVGTHETSTARASFSHDRRTDNGATIKTLRIVPAFMRPPRKAIAIKVLPIPTRQKKVRYREKREPNKIGKNKSTGIRSHAHTHIITEDTTDLVAMKATHPPHSINLVVIELLKNFSRKSEVWPVRGAIIG
jgi:hypothetical protein